MPILEPDSDLIVDPYGQLFCFVCRVNVPKGTSNISQHLEGKKHETNNKLFSSLSEKKRIRGRYTLAADEQRNSGVSTDLVQNSVSASPPIDSASLPPQPDLPAPVPRTSPTITGSLPQPVAKPVSSDGASLTRVRNMAKNALRKELASKFQSFNIDKNAYLNSLISASDDDSDAADVTDLDEQAVQSADNAPSDRSALIGMENRQQPFGPIALKPPEGPDYFFESMAAETEPTGRAASIRDLLSVANSETKATEDADAPAYGKRSQQTKNAIVKVKTTINGGDKFNDYIKLSQEKGDAEEDEEAEREKARKRALQSLQILRDSNGEELPPWLLDPDSTENVLYSSDSSISLHFEILEFSRFVSPTEIELSSRNEMVMMVESIVRSIWPSSTTEVFGSYATGLYLPTSDIDICVRGTPEGGEMKEIEQLAEAVRNVSGFARRVHVIRAKVPLVKVISRKTSMNCDICVGMDNGPNVVPLIKKYLKEYSALRPLLLVIKCFLHQRDLNEVFTGGLGSYTVFLLVVSHLQMLKYNFPDSKTNLGAVLQSFFQFYGRMFNLCIAGIQVKDNGCYFDKFDRYNTPPQDTLRFSVEDPNDASNELGKNGYGVMKVRKAFNNASMTLVKWRRDDSSAAPTPLGSILHFDDDLRIRRENVVEDMQKKGQKPLRFSLSETEPGERQAVGTIIPHSKAENPDGSTVKNSTSAGKGEDQESRYHNSRDLRDRDPRLVKRRRSTPGQEPERPHSAAKTSGQSNVWSENHTRSNMQLNQRSPGNQHSSTRIGGVPNARASTCNTMYQSTDTNYQGGISYGDQQNYSEYPPRQYPVSTPGYQYVDQQPRAGGAVPSSAMYSNAGPISYGQSQQSIQRMAEGRHKHSSKNQMYSEHTNDSHDRRGQFKKRGSFGKRDSYRSR